MKHEVLDGLPPYGPSAKAFSATGMGTHREGFVVKFFPNSGNDWVGNFQPGLSAMSEVIDHPNGHNVVVISGGQAYLINPETGDCEHEFGGQIESILYVPEMKAIVFGNGLWFEAIGPDGFLWTSRRISWDGMRNVKQKDLRLIGESYDPIRDGWCKFSLDLATGEVKGGSYRGPDAPIQQKTPKTHARYNTYVPTVMRSVKGIDTHMVDQRRKYLQLTLFLTAFFLFWTVRCMFYAVDESIASLTLRAVYSNLMKFLMWILPAVVFVYVLRGVHPVKYLGLSTWPSRRNWLICISVITAYLIVVALFKMTGGNKSFSMNFISKLPITYWFIMTLLPPFLEELFFRGFLMTELLTLMPLYRALVLTSLLFAAIHLPFWLIHGAAARVILTSGGAAFVFSILTGWLFARTGSIWPSTIAHIAANLFPQFFV